MSKKVLSIFLALVLMIPSFASAEIADPPTLKEILQAGTRQDADGEAGALASRTLDALLYQANGKLTDEDKVEVIVSFRPEAFSDLGKEIPAKALYQGENVEKQQNLGEEVVAEGLRRIKSEIGTVDTIFEYHVLFFGFSAELTFEQAKKIAQMDFVDFVEITTERTKPALKDPMPVMTKDPNKIQLRSAETDPYDVREIVGRPETFENFKGEGTLIAIIDSGYDVTHRSFYLSEKGNKNVKLSKDAVQEMLSQGKLKGEYVKDKIPFVYNYREFNTNVKEANPHSHGQHVAGIAAGNSVKYLSGSKTAYFAGIAPEAQLALMRVFKDGSPGTSSAFYAKALDDAAILKADSANMSLGAPAGDYNTMDKHTIDALKKLKEAGCVVAIAAGNETAFGNDLGILPDVNNPDYGILGTPAIEEHSMAVASLQNNVIVQPFFEILSSKDATKGEVQSISWQKTLGKFEEKVYEYAYAGLGREEDVKDMDLQGKFALIERGEITFSAKVQNAVNKGAIGVIIFNSAAGGEQFVGMAGVDKATVPVGSILRSVGLALSKEQKWLKLTKNKGTFSSKTAGYMSDFSSFGLTADGEFKPDITAPGGNIYSLANDQEFVSTSGTSMASPQVAGGIALVRKRVAEDFPNLSQAEQWQLVRNLLMSTTVIHHNPDTKAPSSPRHQGAGIMWLTRALSSKVVLIGDKGETKILRNKASDKETLSFQVKNYSNEEKTFERSVVVVTDEVKNGRFTLKPENLELNIPKATVVVPANGEVTVEVTIDSSSKTAELQGKMPNGYFVDGFIKLTDGKDEELSIPFVTFIGQEKGLEGVDYVEAPIYDLVKAGRRPFYFKQNVNSHWSPEKNLEYTHPFVELDKETEILGAVHGFDFHAPKFEDKLVISPNDDKMADDMNLVYVMLRNGFTQVDIYPVGDDGKRIEDKAQVLQKKTWKQKNYGSNDPNQLNAQYAGFWPNQASGKVADGNYVAVIHSWGTKPGAEKAKDVEIPFIVDRTRPTAKNASFDDNTRVLSFEPEDNIQVKFVEVSHGVDKDKKMIPYDEASKGYKIPDGVALKDVDIVIWDLGYNKLLINGETIKDIDNIGHVEVKLDWRSRPDKYSPKYVIKSQDPNDKKTYEANFLPYGKYVLEFKRPSDYKNYIFHDEANYDAATNMYRYPFEVTKEKPEATVTITLERIYRIEVEVHAFKEEGQKVDAEYRKIYDNIESVKVISKKDFSETDLKFKYDGWLGGYMGYNRDFLYGEYEAVVKMKDGAPNYKMRLYQRSFMLGSDEDTDRGEYEFRFPIYLEEDSFLTKDGKMVFLIELFRSDINKLELTKVLNRRRFVFASDAYKNADKALQNAYMSVIHKGLMVLWNRDATQQMVDDAVKAIEAAEAKFGPIVVPPAVDKTELARAIKNAEDAMKTEQFKNAPEALQKELAAAIEKGKEILNKSAATEQEVQDAVKAITDAIKKIGIVDMMPLDKAVKAAEDLKKGYQYKNASKELQDALDAAIKAATDLKKKPGVTEQEVKDAVAAIEKAIEDIKNAVALPQTAELEKATKAAEDLKKGYQYKNADEALKTALDDALANGKALLAKVKKHEKVEQNEIDAAKKAIEDAIKAIEQAVAVPDLDPSKLDQAVKDAEAVKNDAQYGRATDEQKEALENALKDGKALLDKIANKEKVTQTEINQATKAIEDAIKAIGIIDLSELDKALKDAEAAKASDKYKQAPQAVKEAIDQAIENAKAVKADPNVTKEQAAEAVKKIEAVLAAFALLPDKAPIDKSNLKYLVEDAPNVKAKDEYKNADIANQKRYDYAIDAGQALLNDQNATQQAVDKAIEEILGAIDALEIKDQKLPPKTGMLEYLVKDADNVKKSDSYVGASDQELREDYDKAIAEAQALLDKVANKEDVTQDEVDDAVKAIEAAIMALDGEPKKQPEPEPQPQPPSSGSASGGSSRASVRPDPVGKAKDETIKDNKTPLAEQPLPLATLKIGSKEYKALEDGKIVDKMMDVAPMIHKGRTMLPARAIAELLGIEVKFDEATKTATFVFVKEEDGKKVENTVELTLGKNVMTVNGKAQMLSGEVLNVKGRVLLPMTDVQKALKELGLKIDVKWEHQTKSISLEKVA
ncbi:MAG: S8 family serine peptidase [Peptostreptococcaceae bacterium]|nr:S8 family serine peptidase [Peptostreptococcaceae bacterium]